MDVLCGLALFVAIVVLILVVLRRVGRLSPESIAKERASAEKQARVIIEATDDDVVTVARWILPFRYFTSMSTIHSPARPRGAAPRGDRKQVVYPAADPASTTTLSISRALPICTASASSARPATRRRGSSVSASTISM